MKLLSYKGYTGSFEYSVEDNILYGRVLGIKSLIMYEGKTVKSLIKDFHDAVDNYINSCIIDNIEAEKPFKGSFNVRIDSSLHEKGIKLAYSNNISLNKLVENAIDYYINNHI